VGPEVVDQTRVAFVRDEAQLLTERKGEMCLDLWRANVLALEEAGVHSIEVAGLCTACHTGNWFSHRGEHGRTGRFGALIALREA
jgi:purine-nucleoside/S-methyl-5'-thioadenosine phosphorylase / adenosine deaminase